jgi:hypothetical protein
MGTPTPARFRRPKAGRWSTGSLYEARAIVDMKNENGKRMWLVAWKGVDPGTGKP